jgi:uncharacterized protein (DUF433 family)
MATPEEMTAFPYILKTPGVRAGKARVDGTRMCRGCRHRVQPRARTRRDPTYFSSRPLTLAEVHAALAYLYAHPEELTDYVECGERLQQELKVAQAEYLRRKSAL